MHVIELRIVPHVCGSFQQCCPLQENARVFFDLLSNMKGLVPIKPSGAMYMMVKIDLEFFPDFDSDIQFTERLMTEESIFCLPASVRLIVSLAYLTGPYLPLVSRHMQL